MRASLPMVTGFVTATGQAFLFCTILLVCVHLGVSAGQLRPDDYAIDHTRSVFTQSDPCGTVEDRLKCVAHTHPVFHNDNCDRWDCDPLLSSGLPFSCCMGETTRSEVVDVLNDSAIVWVGDSTARRANKQLYFWMEGIPFEDSPIHYEVGFNFSSITSVSLWVPSFKSAVPSFIDHHFHVPRKASKPPAHLRSVHSANNGSRALSSPPYLYPPEFEKKRKVFVFCISTHTLMGFWKAHTVKIPKVQKLVTGLESDLKRVVTEPVNIISGLKRFKGVDPKRDIILFRLPIAQACESFRYTNLCETLGVGIDPINIFVERFQRILVPMMQEAHPDVGLLDLLSWTWSRGRVDRAKCTPSDNAGTHFGTDTARMAFVQQVLHAVRLLSVGRPGWEASSPSITQSLCPAHQHM